MAKTLLSMPDLRRRALAEIRKQAGCHNVQDIAINRVTDERAENNWSLIFYVADVDALYARALAAGYQPAAVPHDAEWGERFFHLIDPDGHELSFARPLLPVSVQ
jgi:uncharacterized glyoxalase superfamily protein PhnB